MTASVFFISRAPERCRERGGGQIPAPDLDQPKLTRKNFSKNRPSTSSVTRLSQEDIAFFTMLADVESLQLVLLADSQSHHGVEDLQEYHCSYNTDQHCRSNTDSLVDEL